MGVKINRVVEPEKPLFEDASGKEEAAPPPVKKKFPEPFVDKSLPFPFHMQGTPPTPGWGKMEDAPKDRPILVCCQIDSLPNQWMYYEVQWFKPPDWNMEGWFVVGTQWHMLWHAMPKGWREAVGHP